MLLPHHGHWGGGHEHGRPSVSPPDNLAHITLYLNIPPGLGGMLHSASREHPSIQARASTVGT